MERKLQVNSSGECNGGGRELAGRAQVFIFKVPSLLGKGT